jgi:hypothetical protein
LYFQVIAARKCPLESLSDEEATLVGGILWSYKFATNKTGAEE